MEQNHWVTYMSEVGKVILAVVGVGLLVVSSADKIITAAIKAYKKCFKELRKR